VKAREYLGTPYHHIGRKKGIGVDCIGLISGVAQELGMTYHDLKVYSQRPDGVTLLREFDKCLTRVPTHQPGDVLVFRFRKFATHAGIVTDYGLIHTYATVGKVVEHVLDATWERRIVQAYRFPGIQGDWVPSPVPNFRIPDDFEVEQERRRLQQGGCCN
jgi:NlpC/P60 family putative phage cell wall peptidase